MNEIFILSKKQNCLKLELWIDFFFILIYKKCKNIWHIIFCSNQNRNCYELKNTAYFTSSKNSIFCWKSGGQIYRDFRFIFQEFSQFFCFDTTKFYRCFFVESSKYKRHFILVDNFSIFMEGLIKKMNALKSFFT